MRNYYQIFWNNYGTNTFEYRKESEIRQFKKEGKISHFTLIEKMKGMETEEHYFDIAPLSEQTLKKHNWRWKGLEFFNDFGFPCDYRVVQNGKELGRIKYYQGRKLSCYEVLNRD